MAPLRVYRVGAAQALAWRLRFSMFCASTYERKERPLVFSMTCGVRDRERVRVRIGLGLGLGLGLGIRIRVRVRAMQPWPCPLPLP